MEIGKGKEGKEMDGKREKVMMEIKDHTKKKEKCRNGEESRIWECRKDRGRTKLQCIGRNAKKKEQKQKN